MIIKWYFHPATVLPWIQVTRENILTGEVIEKETCVGAESAVMTIERMAKDHPYDAVADYSVLCSI